MQTKLFRISLAMAFLTLPGIAGAEDAVTAPRRPVLVELFTSEGCSSCPPADALLEKLDRDQPIAGAQIIVLSEHVDYWNRLGWKDPFSASAFTARQEQYDRRFGLSGPYTPEMVVDGSAEFNGSDARAAESAVRQALEQPAVGVRIRPHGNGEAAVTVEVDPLPAGKTRKANVFVAFAADHGTSDVLRGENQGRSLHHVAIVADIQQAGTIDAHAGFSGKIPLRAGRAPGGSRLIVFIQEGGIGRVWGVASKVF